MKRLRLDSREVGGNAPAWIIAEIGVNHDGVVERAHELIEHAAAAGADAVKVQCFHADSLASPGAQISDYQRAQGREALDQRALLSRLELSPEALESLAHAAAARGLAFLGSPFDLESLEELLEVGVSAIKIASGEMTNVPLLRRSIASGKPLLISTGMASWEEIDRVAAILGAEEETVPAVFLHCVTRYPTPIDAANVRAVVRLRERTGSLAGYSDHCREAEASLAARALGACVLEKHLTYDSTAVGPDHACSLDPREFREWVQSIRRLEAALGDGEKVHSSLEEEGRRKARKAIVAARSLRKGETLSEDDLTTRRPAEAGIDAAAWDDVIGRAVGRDLEAGTPICEEDLLEGEPA